MRHLFRKTCACLVIAGICACPGLSGLAENERLDEETNLALETVLSELGYFTEVPDANGDESTRIALANYQTANSLEATGRLDAETTRRLRGRESVSKEDYLNGLAERYQSATLAQGDTGREVSLVQQALSRLGYYGGRADGAFGAATGEAVSLFQRSVGLDSTGIADGPTLYRLIEGELPTREEFLLGKCANKGEAGSRVKLAQQKLKAMGLFSGDCTGAYGDMTARAVEAFQTENSLSVNGQLDVDTCDALYLLTGRAERAGWTLGETGEAVRLLQQELSGLGYYTGTNDGAFNSATQTALNLYRIANPEGDGAIDPDQALSLADAGDKLRASRQQTDPETLENVARSAEALLGQPFGRDENPRFPGFAFVQSVFALNGIAFTEPGEIVGGAAETLSPDALPRAGAIVVMERERNGAPQLALSVSLGNGRLAFPDEQGAYIISGELAKADYSKAYIWLPEIRDER